MDDAEIAALQISSLRQQVEGLKTVNGELVKTVQQLKLAAKDREHEKLELMKEINQLRMKLCCMSGSAEQADEFELRLRKTIEGAVSHMISATDLVSSSLKILNDYGEKRRDLQSRSPRWSNLSSPRTCEKVKNKVRPISIGGRNIQPVVALNRIQINNNSIRSPRNREHGITEALPMHLLQDLFVPLMRIDSDNFLANNETADGDSTEDVTDNAMDDSLTNDEEIDGVRMLDGIQEDEESNEHNLSARSPEDPQEGPSWLLEVPTVSHVQIMSVANGSDSVLNNSNNSFVDSQNDTRLQSHVFTPTVRRRKRNSSPPSPNLLPRHSNGCSMRTKRSVSLPENNLVADDDTPMASCSGEQSFIFNQRHSSNEIPPQPTEPLPLCNGGTVGNEEEPGCSGEGRTSTTNGFVISYRAGIRSRDIIIEVDDDSMGTSGCSGAPTTSKNNKKRKERNIKQELKIEEDVEEGKKPSSHMEILNGRVLKVSLTKMNVDEDCGDTAHIQNITEQPTCSTIGPVLRVSLTKINMKENEKMSEELTRSRNTSRNRSKRSTRSRERSMESTESRSTTPDEVSGKRVRRSRKDVTYKEKPLNRKLRR